MVEPVDDMVVSSNGVLELTSMVWPIEPISQS